MRGRDDFLNKSYRSFVDHPDLRSIAASRWECTEALKGHTPVLRLVFWDKNAPVDTAHPVQEYHLSHLLVHRSGGEHLRVLRLSLYCRWFGFILKYLDSSDRH
ncbi:hypothetical protein PILCRDRAFT_123289 [Piloderma croceum F 1598]|uniref:Uncharacterized protein n=1 Tax=Piloderma croceum (strain F 1598) TaxID=765440 RepID=A0A0C3C0T0_PILCF|nr:hypothetical protein PILCRDRAFT_123289 [Piloderma croceum F 1598]